MDKYERRRVALDALITSLGKGGPSLVAERIGKNLSYVSRMRYPVTKPGFKRVGEDTVDLLDKAFPGWMPPQAVSETTATWPPVDRIRATPPPTLAQCMEVLALHLNSVPPQHKEAAKSMLSALVSSPALHASIAETIERMCAPDDANAAAA